MTDKQLKKSLLFPEMIQRKQDENSVAVCYKCMCEWGWSYKQFIDTPIYVIRRLIEYEATRPSK